MSSSSSFRFSPSAPPASHSPISARIAAISKATVKATATTVAVVLAVVASVSPARATPVDVFFNGPTLAGDSSTAFGISLASATTANTTYGVPIIDQATVSSPFASYLSVILPPSSSLVASPNPPTSSLNRVASEWQIENVSPSVLTGASYLLFTNTSPHSVGNTQIDYPDGDVGLKIDKDLGWVIVKLRSAGVDYYYPALLLDRSAETALAGNIAVGERVSATINYVVAQALVQAGGDYQLPKLNLGLAQVVVPEPGTVLLLGLGLTLLAGRRQRG